MPSSSFIDARGRTIVISDLNVVGQLRLVRLIGDENATYFAICKKLAMVDSIDGETFTLPRGILGFERIARKLGDDGLMALTLHLAERDALRIPDVSPTPDAAPEPAPGAIAEPALPVPAAA